MNNQAVISGNTLEAFDKITDYRKNGTPKGLSTGWPTMDNNFTMVKGQLNIVSGFPSSGKSEWVENIACHAVMEHKWNVLMYCPESYPLENHVKNLLQRISRKPVYGKNHMTDQEMWKAQHPILKRFDILSADEEPYNLDQIFSHIDLKRSKGFKIDMVVLDPFNEMDGSRPSGMSETDFIGDFLMKCRRYARKNAISFWIVCHPAKPSTKNKQGEYDPPDLYDLAGSSHWRNKTDNGFIVHRYSLDSVRVVIMIKKIKNSMYGKPGQVCLDFVPQNSTYQEVAE